MFICVKCIKYRNIQDRAKTDSWTENLRIGRKWHPHSIGTSLA